MSNSDDVLIKVENVSKKFCRSLKRSMLYGIEDIARDSLHLPDRSDQLRKDEFWAVDDVSFEVKRGECLGIIGRNGAGKSTLLKMLNGIFMPDKGKITIKGKVGALIEVGAGFHPMLTGRENVYVNGAILGMSKREIDKKFDEIVAFAELEEFIDMPVKHYSSGMYVRLGFAIAAQMEPDILILDEVLAVGDVSFQAKCMNTIARFRKQGTAFLLVSHNMHQVSRYSDRALYLKQGNNRYLGPVAEGTTLLLKDMNEIKHNFNQDIADWNHIYGSGKVKFTNSYFLNSDDAVVNEIAPGESVKWQIDFECAKNISNGAILDICIRNNDEELFRECSKPFYTLPSHGRFEVFISYLPINAHSLHFSITLLEKDTKEVYDWKRNIKLNIKYNPSYHGKLVLPVTWSIT